MLMLQSDLKKLFHTKPIQTRQVCILNLCGNQLIIVAFYSFRPCNHTIIQSLQIEAAEHQDEFSVRNIV